MDRYASAIFVVLISMTAIFVEDSTLRYPIVFTLLTTTLFTVIIYNLLCFKSMKTMYAKSFAHWKLSLALMVLTAIVFVLCFFCTELIGGSAYNSLFFVCSGIFGSLLDKSKEQKLVGVLLITLVFAYIAMLCLETPQNVTSILIGVGYGLIGGICGFIYAKCSHTFAVRTGLNTVQILAIRFILMLVGLLFFISPDMIGLLSVQSILYMFFLSMVSNVLPVYFFQRGIIASGPEKNAIAIAFVPVMTMVIGALKGSEFLSKTDIYFSVLLTVFLMIPTLLLLRGRIRKKGRVEKMNA